MTIETVLNQAKLELIPNQKAITATLRRNQERKQEQHQRWSSTNPRVQQVRSLTNMTLFFNVQTFARFWSSLPPSWRLVNIFRGTPWAAAYRIARKRKYYWGIKWANKKASRRSNWVCKSRWRNANCSI